MNPQRHIADDSHGESRMSPELWTELEERRKYLENRARFPLEELAQFAGQWIAWRPDGACIVAHATNPEALEDLILDAGEDPERCIVEGIPGQDTVFGGYSGLER